MVKTNARENEMYNKRRALWLTIIIMLWVACVITLFASGVNAVSSEGSGNDSYGRIESVLGAAVAALAGAMAYMFKQWQKRDEQWVEHFMRMIHDNRGLSDNIRRMTVAIENLPCDQCRRNPNTTNESQS